MKRVWGAAKFVGRWAGPALLILAFTLLVFPPTPFGEASVTPALWAVILCAVAFVLARGPANRKRRLLLGLAVCAGLALYGWRSWDERRGYREETIAFDSQGTRLVGTLFLPERSGTVPGMVFLPGSGAVPRSFYRHYAAHFAKLGFAVLLYDKRGIGDSEGKVATRNFLDTDADNNFEQLAIDASAALSFLEKRSEVRRDLVGISGVSEGGWIAPRAAELNGQAAFMLNITSPTIRLYDVLEYQVANQGLSGRELAVAKHRFAADFDPLPSLRVINIPGMWIMAEGDSLVPNEPTIRILDGLRASGKPYEYRMISGAWHGLIIAPKSLVLSTIDDWLAKVTKTHKAT